MDLRTPNKFLMFYKKFCNRPGRCPAMQELATHVANFHCSALLTWKIGPAKYQLWYSLYDGCMTRLSIILPLMMLAVGHKNPIFPPCCIELSQKLQKIDINQNRTNRTRLQTPPSIFLQYSIVFPLIGTSYPEIATNFKSFYLAEIFVLLLWNLSWRLLLPCPRISQFFIIFSRLVLEISDSSFWELSKIRGPL